MIAPFWTILATTLNTCWPFSPTVLKLFLTKSLRGTISPSCRFTNPMLLVQFQFGGATSMPLNSSPGAAPVPQISIDSAALGVHPLSDAEPKPRDASRITGRSISRPNAQQGIGLRDGVHVVIRIPTGGTRTVLSRYLKGTTRRHAGEVRRGPCAHWLQKVSRSIMCI